MDPETVTIRGARPRWRRRLAVIRRGGMMPLVEIAVLIVAVTMGVVTWFAVNQSTAARPLTPPVTALLLVANLVPTMALMVLIARRVALRRRASGGGGRLHVRLVAMFSFLAALPTLAVVIFASLLFQYGVEFWFSDSARKVLENSDRVARAYVEDNEERLRAEITAMAKDFRDTLAIATVDDPRFPDFVARQGQLRGLSEIALIEIGSDGIRRAPMVALADTRPLERRLPAEALGPLNHGDIYLSPSSGDRIEALIALDPRTRTYLYASRFVDPLVLTQVKRTQAALGDYNSLLERSRSLQLRFNAALLLVSLLIVGAAIIIALAVADRLVRPVGELVGAARRITIGDLSARVARPARQDELGTLATAFNRMTRRLEEQTGALVTANAQLGERRAFIEAVLSGVTAGIVSVGEGGQVRLLNSSAAELLRTDEAAGRPLAEVAPELGALLASGQSESVIQLASGGELRTLAVKIVRVSDGHVITFDDITDQLADQRRAAWSDVARRIAHEIKNPLTPISLAAERLQRRYGKEIASDPETFRRLTETIVRQVGDLRRMVDEFSSFARMPKPEFAPERIVDIARAALFLHEVAHPSIAFRLAAEEPGPEIVCDRRQLGQALTNLVKNAVEAICDRTAEGEPPVGHVWMTVAEDGGRVLIAIADDGCGLPAERERLTEPYMTTRAKGTGLGLAIVRKIAEEHLASIAFSDREGGGTIVRLVLDPRRLAPLAGLGAHGPEADDARLPALTRMKAG